MALSDIRTRISDNVNRDDITDTQYDRWINDIQRLICRGYNFTFMEAEVTASTVDGQRSYALPLASGSVTRYKSEINLELIDANNERKNLTKMSKRSIENMPIFHDLDDNGTPSHYCFEDGQIHLYHKPDHSDNGDTAWTINFEYYGYLADLSADTDTNNLIGNFPEVVEAGATWLAFRWSKEEERASFWKTEFNHLFSMMITEDQANALGTMEQGIEPMDGSGVVPRTGSQIDLKAFYA